VRARTRRSRIVSFCTAPFRTVPFCFALFFATDLSCAAASAAIPAPVAKLAGCYHVTLSRSAGTATDAWTALHRTVEFFAELSTAKIADAADSHAVRENKSSGYGRLFKRARWHVEKNQNVIVVFSDGAEEWSATLKSAGTRLSGTATYSGDIDHPERHWSAAASRYTCRRQAD
jgi:hypothetical protein